MALMMLLAPIKIMKEELGYASWVRNIV